MIKRVLALVLACLLALSATGCGKAKGPEDTLTAFQTAFNHYDLDAMLDCVEPTMATLIRSLLDVEGRNYSLSYSLIFSLVKLGFPLLPMLTDGAIRNEDLPKLSLEYGRVRESGDEAFVPVDGTLTVGDGSMSFSVTVNLLHIANGEWVIVGLEEADADATADTPAI